MPEGGLEPPRDKVPADFESAAYANFATPAETNYEANTLQIKASTADSLAGL
jgi:hypothetical protein